MKAEPGSFPSGEFSWLSSSRVHKQNGGSPTDKKDKARNKPTTKTKRKRKPTDKTTAKHTQKETRGGQ
jgi:hypothetical protein